MFGLNKQTFFFFGSRGHPDPKPLGRTKAWCVLALLYAAARSDPRADKGSDMRAEEEIAIDSLAMRSRTLFGLSQEEIDRCMDEYRAMLEGRNSVSSLVEAACESLPSEEGLAEAVFAQCADIVMADRDVDAFERDFLTELAGLLRLSQAKRRDILQVMLWKNEFRETA